MQKNNRRTAVLNSRAICELVFARDKLTCQMCGATDDDIESRAMSITVFPPQPSLTAPSEIDMKTLCPDCATGVRTAVFELRMNAQELLVQVRRATARNQLAVLDWLLKKYPQRGAK